MSLSDKKLETRKLAKGFPNTYPEEDIKKHIQNAQERLKEICEKGEENYPEIEAEETEQIGFIEDFIKEINKIFTDEFGEKLISQDGRKAKVGR